MIKTLRITSSFAVVLAVVFFASPAVFGVRGDKQIEQFLNSAGAIEEFKQARGDKIGAQQQEISPLVTQAERFALYLNPPPKPSTASTTVTHSEQPKPKSVSPKFRLVGTSRHQSHPELSLALIDEPGKGLRWVRSSSKVGHLIIEQVRDGLVVIRDGENTSELVAERPVKKSLLKSSSPSGQIRPQTEASGRITAGIPQEINTETQPTAEEAAMMMEEDAQMKKILAELDAMQTETETGETDYPAPGGEEIATALKGPDEAAGNGKPAPSPETMRISTREARKLGRLGRRLKNVQREPNQVGENRTESDANLTE